MTLAPGEDAILNTAGHDLAKVIFAGTSLHLHPVSAHEQHYEKHQRSD